MSKVKGGEGSTNALRLACRSLKQAVDAVTTKLTWQEALRRSSMAAAPPPTRVFFRVSLLADAPVMVPQATDLTEALGGDQLPGADAPGVPAHAPTLLPGWLPPGPAAPGLW